MKKEHFSIKEIDSSIRQLISPLVGNDQLFLYTIIEKDKTSNTLEIKRKARGSSDLLFDYLLEVYKDPKIDTVCGNVKILKESLQNGMSIEELRHIFEVAMTCIKMGVADSILDKIYMKGGYDA